MTGESPAPAPQPTPDAPPTDAQPAPAPLAPPSRRHYLVPAAIIAVVALLIAGVLWIRSDGDQSSPDDQAGPASTAEEPAAIEHPSAVAVPDLSAEEGRDDEDLLATGPADAPVVLVVFSDFQCPYCARWHEDTLPVMQEYVERGELRIEWREVNVYGEDSERAARATLAAAMQGRLTEYQDLLFAGGEIRSSSELSEESLIGYADELGLDTEQFTTDLRSEQVAQTVEENQLQGMRLGIMSTPAFIVGGTPMVGAQPTAEFTQLVDDALAEQGG